MSTLTIRIPDDTHGRLKEIARQRGMSVNKLVEELSTVAIAPYDAETRLRVMAARGSVEEGLRVLDQAGRCVRPLHGLRARTPPATGHDRTPG